VSGLFGHRESPIGVDFDGRYLRAAQLARAADGWRLQAAVRIPRVAPEEALGPRDIVHLRDTLERLGFRGKRLVLGVPEDKLAVDVLELPPRNSRAPVDDIARTELARTHGYDAAAAEMVSWDLPPSSRARDMTQMMAVALPHAVADALLDAFDGAGLEVTVLDTHMAATIRACRPLLPDDGLTAVLTIGWDCALLLLWLDGTVIYRRLMPENSLRCLTAAVARNLNLPADAADCVLEEVGLADRRPEESDTPLPLDALRTIIQKPINASAEAVRAAFAYAAQMYVGTQTTGVLVTGPAAAVPGATEHLASRLDMNVRTVTPGDVVGAAPAVASEAGHPALTPAVGLAMYSEGRNRAKPQPHTVAQA
jgi:Tfp pilus assembly PilM family ATPase